MTTPFGRTIACAAIVALAGAAVVSGGCQPPAQRKPIEMAPIGTVPAITRTSDDGDGGSTTSPNSGSGTAAAPKESACTSSEFEALDDALRQCDAAMPKSGEVPSGMRDRLDVRVSPSSPSTTPGGRVDVTVTFKNKSNDPLPLYFSGDPQPKFDVEALDGKGKRVDVPSGKPPKTPAMPSRDVKAFRVVLLPGGTAKVRIPWDAVKTRWAPEKVKSWDGRGYARAPSGPLAVGKYMLRVVLPLIGVFEKGELEIPKIPMDVGS